MPAVNLSPVFIDAQLDSSGNPYSGALLFTYAAGSSTPATTYTSSAGSTAQANPIVLNSRGEPASPIWLTDGSSYKFILAAPGDTVPTSPIRTIDNVTGVNDAAASSASEWPPSGLTPTYVSSSSFSLSGDQTTEFHVGRRLKLTDGGGTDYAAISKSAHAAGTTTITIDATTLTTPVSAVSLGINSAANTSVPFVSRDQQCGRLTRTSATLIQLDPMEGNTVWMFIGSNWCRRLIPSAGVTAANTSIFIDGTGGQNLAASTTYYVYLFDNAGVLTMDFSTTAPAVDATSGLKIKTGVATRLLIGIARTNASSQFELVLSMYRRRGIEQQASLTTTRTTTSTTAVELNAEIRVPFLSWADEAVLAQFTGLGENTNAGASHSTYITLDGITTKISGIVLEIHTPAINHRDNASCGGLVDVAEGYHYATITVLVSANTGSWDAGTLFVLTQG